MVLGGDVGGLSSTSPSCRTGRPATAPLWEGAGSRCAAASFSQRRTALQRCAEIARWPPRMSGLAQPAGFDAGLSGSSPPMDGVPAPRWFNPAQSPPNVTTASRACAREERSKERESVFGNCSRNPETRNHKKCASQNRKAADERSRANMAAKHGGQCGVEWGCPIWQPMWPIG